MALTIICTDVETREDLKAKACLPPVVHDQRLKDPDKIEADIAKKLASLSLHPGTNEIIALGHVVIGSNEPQCMVFTNHDEERAGLQQFWTLYRRYTNVRFLTYYGMAFDLPTLVLRSLILDVDAPYLNLNKYRSPHAAYDICWQLTFEGAIKPYGLKFWAQRFGLDPLDKVDGKDVATLAADGDWEAVRAHCLSDVALTHAVAHRLRDARGEPLVPL